MGTERGTETDVTAGWEDLEFGEAVSRRLRQDRREGLSMNRAAPDEILVGLLGISDQLLYRADLPQAVVEAAIAHPDRRVRGSLAEHRGVTLRFLRTGTRTCVTLTTEQWSRLVRGEPDDRRRYGLAYLADAAGGLLTEDVYEALAAARSDEARADAASLPRMPHRLLRALAADPAATVRAAAAEAGWADFDEAIRARLAEDPAEVVRTAVALARHEEAPVTCELFDRARVTFDLVETRRLDRDLVQRLSGSPDPTWRRFLAENPYLEPGQVAVLAADPDRSVRLAVSLRPELTEDERAASCRAWNWTRCAAPHGG